MSEAEPQRNPTKATYRFSQNRAYERMWRFRVVASASPLVFGLLFLLLRNSFTEKLVFDSPIDRFLYSRVTTPAFTILIYGMIVFGLGMLLMLYLDTGFRSPRLLPVRVPDVAVSPIAQTEAVVLNTDAGPADGIAVNPEPYESITKPPEKQSISPETYIRQTTDRLKDELDALSYRVKLNLVIGILTTISGAALLAYFVIVKQPPIKEFSSPSWYLAEFVPRLSIVLLIEVFAYFFLKLYKATLSDVKYFQNELTNFECRALALASAVERNDAKSIAAVIMELSKTERNFISKNLTTLDLERSKAEQQSLADVLKHVASIVESGTGGSPAKRKQS